MDLMITNSKLRARIQKNEANITEILQEIEDEELKQIMGDDKSEQSNNKR